MKKLTICLLCLTFSVAAIKSADGATGKDAMAQLAAMLPKTVINGFSKTPIPGIFEVDAGPQIFYFSPKGYLFFGEIWDRRGHSLTAERRKEIISEKLKTLPLDKAVTIGKGPHQVIEFTDPDCPFCRRVDAYLEAHAASVTRHVFFFPLGIHPHSRDHALYILGSPNPEKAMKEVYSGKWDKKAPAIPLKPGKIALLDENLRLGGSLGVRGTPTLWVDGHRIGGADIEAIASIINHRR